MNITIKDECCILQELKDKIIHITAYNNLVKICTSMLLLVSAYNIWAIGSMKLHHQTIKSYINKRTSSEHTLFNRNITKDLFCKKQEHYCVTISIKKCVCVCVCVIVSIKKFCACVCIRKHTLCGDGDVKGTISKGTLIYSLILFSIVLQLVVILHQQCSNQPFFGIR